MMALVLRWEGQGVVNYHDRTDVYRAHREAGEPCKLSDVHPGFRRQWTAPAGCHHHLRLLLVPCLF